MLYMVRRERDEEQEGSYGVGLLIALRNEAELRYGEMSDQPDEEGTYAEEADSVWEEWEEEE